MRFPALIICLLFPAPVQAAVVPDLEKARTWWAFQPVRHDIAPPAVQDAGWCRNEIDRFILAKLEAGGQKPSPPADPRRCCGD